MEKCAVVRRCAVVGKEVRVFTIHSGGWNVARRSPRAQPISTGKNPATSIRDREGGYPTPAVAFHERPVCVHLSPPPTATSGGSRIVRCTP
jgi:hypothetical protein